MGPSKLLAALTAAVVLPATLIIGQEQGPLKDPGATVSRPRKPADADKNPDTDLPKIPSRLKKDPAKETGDFIEMGTLQSALRSSLLRRALMSSLTSRMVPRSCPNGHPADDSFADRSASTTRPSPSRRQVVHSSCGAAPSER